ncbi:hypothetical protein BJF78_03275 [Pseudonocardia sp. CNS-139]|nr:hypothetical protein BJF78_03275 [Pseudonocardia sp. CNS-139]
MAVLRLRGRMLAVVGAVAVLAVLVAGFAVALGSVAQNGGGEEPMIAIAPAAPAPYGDSDGSASRSSGGAAVGSAPAPEIAQDMARSAPGTAQDSGKAPLQGVPTVDRALIRSAQLSVEVPDPAAAMRQVRTAVAGAGGMITDEQTSDSGSWMTLRVPADSLDRLVDDIAGYGRVTARSTQVYDATEESIDLDARVATQQASVARVRALLAQAETIGDVVAIESELSRREAELDSLTRRLEALRNQVAMSTLTVDLRGPGAAVPPAGPPPGFLDGLASGWAGLQLLGAGVGTAVGFVLPFLPVVAVIVGVVWLVRRVARGRRRPVPAAPAPPAES